MISTRGLEKRFGPTVALREIDLEIARGDCLAVLGPNGAGKSTLLRLMAGLARPSAGTVEIDGGRADRPEARARVGLIGHETFLYPELTARENLVFAAKLHSVPDGAARADRLLDEEGLAAVAERPAGAISRGMAQRLAIARGLVHDPDVVLLDEPFTGLDRRAAEHLAERLGGLRRDGRTVVIVTHDPPRAAQVAASAIVLARGRLQHWARGDECRPAELERAYLDVVDALP